MENLKREVNLSDFQIEYKLGEGAYGLVYLASKSKQEYAIKEMNKYRLKKLHCEHLPLVQKQILKHLEHPGIIKSHYTFQNQTTLYLVLQLCQGGTFEQLICQNHIDEEIKKFYLAQLVSILQYLHSKGIVHRDFKPSNLMLSKDNHIKVIDFGTASIQNAVIISDSFKEKIAALKDRSSSNIRSEERPTLSKRIKRRKSSFVGTTSYLSPQLLEFNECNAPADLWALGCILYFMYYKQEPFKESNQLQVYHKIQKAHIEFPPNDQLTEEAKDLIQRLLVKNPSERLGSGTSYQLSFQALKKHPYLKQLNIGNIYTMQSPIKFTKFSQLLTQTQRLKIEQIIEAKDSNWVFQKMLIKHSEQGDSIFKIKIKERTILEQYQIGSGYNKPKQYQIQLDQQGKVAVLLSEKRFSIRVKNYQKLIYASKQAKQITQIINKSASPENFAMTST